MVRPNECRKAITPRIQGGNLYEDNYEPQTEAAMCLQEARNMLRGMPDDIRVASEVAAGRWVVAFDEDIYCRATDALVGAVRHFVSAHDSKEEANAACHDEHEFIVEPNNR